MTEKKEVPEKEKKKKIVRKRKSKKAKEKPMVSAIRLAVESGKVVMGSRKAMKAKPKLYVIAKNTPKDIRDNVQKRAKREDVEVLEFEGTSMELGSVCGKPFPVSVLSVHDPGNSPILELAKKK